VASNRTFQTLDFHQLPTNQYIHSPLITDYQSTASDSPKPTSINMASSGFNLPDSLRELFANVKLEDITSAIKNITLADFTHLFNMAKGRELNAETITKLYEEARKLPGVGTTLMAAALVIFVIIFCFPMAAATPFLAALGFTNIGPAAGMNIHIPWFLDRADVLGSFSRCGFPVSLGCQCPLQPFAECGYGWLWRPYRRWCSSRSFCHWCCWFGLQTLGPGKSHLACLSMEAVI
jgi:hypothetical protein